MTTCEAVRAGIECGMVATQRFYWPTAGTPTDRIDLCDAHASAEAESLADWGVIALAREAA